MNADLITQREAARRLGVDKSVIHVLARRSQIPTYSHPMNGKARCFDPDGMAVLTGEVSIYKANCRAQMAARSA